MPEKCDKSVPDLLRGKKEKKKKENSLLFVHVTQFLWHVQHLQ